MITMPSTLFSLSVLGAVGSALASPVSTPPQQNFTFSQCQAGMDGQLPYALPKGFKFSGNVRRYYVASEYVSWDYAPTGWDNWLGVPMNESWRAWSQQYIPSNTSLGTKFDKALYRGYTDATFTKQTEQPDWLGYQGPILRAEVGDMIEILYVNKMTEFWGNMHSMGLYYTKESEGSLYYNSTNVVTEGDRVPPGGCFVYKWLVTETDAPNPGYASKLYSYHGYISMYQDQDAGLSGPVIVYNTGEMEKVMSENREFVIFMGDNQESNSFMAWQNVAKYRPWLLNQFANLTDEYPKITSMANHSLWYPQLVNNPYNNITAEVLPNFFPLNGYIFANNPPLEMCQNENTIWYIWDMGFDTHVMHWHGNNVWLNQLNAGAVSINPGQSTTVTMQPASYGFWHFLCHFNTHLSFGMEAIYIVHPEAECPLPLLKPFNIGTETPSQTASPGGKGDGSGKGSNGGGSKNSTWSKVRLH